jgi:hypothetical protein
MDVEKQNDIELSRHKTLLSSARHPRLKRLRILRNATGNESTVYRDGLTIHVVSKF